MPPPEHTPTKMTYRNAPIGTGRLPQVYPSPDETPRARRIDLQEAVGRQLFDPSKPSLSIRDSRVRELEDAVRRLEDDKICLQNALGSFL
jgi:hypothetical protein